jgi:hypothetical protein
MYAVTSLISFLLFLTATVLLVLKFLKAQKELSEQQTSALKHIANLLVSKDPIAFQQIQTVMETALPTSNNVHAGVYLSGDELELLENQESRLDALWKKLADDTDE